MDFRKRLAEAIGTFWLTFGGCGSAVIAAGGAMAIASPPFDKEAPVNRNYKTNLSFSKIKCALSMAL